MRKIFLTGLIFLMSFGICNAEISKKDVERAWRRISQADGFQKMEITYEKDESPNAWVAFKSSKNYSVHVTAGLMKILNSEEEMAGVWGHEIGHVRLGHYNRGVTRNVIWGVLGAVVDYKTKGSGTKGTLIKGASNIGMNLAENKFSRDDETGADDYGTNLLKKAGYSAWGLYDAMSRFKENNYVTKGGLEGLFSSHPPTEERLNHLRERAQALEPR